MMVVWSSVEVWATFKSFSEMWEGWTTGQEMWLCILYREHDNIIIDPGIRLG